MKTPNSQCPSNREFAMKWWNNLSLENKFYQVIPWLKEQELNVADRHPNSLTGREIEILWNKHKNLNKS